MNDPKIDTAVSLLIHEIKSLKKCCEKVILEEVNGVHIKGILKSLNEEQQKVFMELLPLSISLNITIPVIFDEIYWKRKCVAASWNYLHHWINNCCWRETFICHFVEEAVDNFLAKKRTFKQITPDLEVFVDHLKKVKINGYKGNFAEQKKKMDSASNTVPFGETVGWLFTFFPNLEEVYLNIAPAEYVVSNDDDSDVKENNLFNAIFFLKRLVKLTIIGYSLKDKHVSMLAEYLIGSKVVCLNLSCNLLNDDCCFNLRRVLNSQHLTTLVLSNNCIGSTGITLLLSSLRDSNYLQSLDMSKNYINDDGGVALAEFLKADFALRKLDISFNKLGCKSGKAFNDVLQLNSHLLCLNLSGNTLGKEVGKMFAESIFRNKSIRYLGVEFCGFDEKEEDIIYTRIHSNTNADGAESIF